ncbi:Golgin subfamily A member 1 [Frankliniella fusca]|uniref:Golgin subfamily A member 1 n=1 Tax=Frankliniella fusca TaxID=407009 RepID=A0AAE1L7D5_9NEOP|nr:Golgin subfamily A member 1 [Frankliniella fusca]
MFKGLKNKIREETGSDVSRIIGGTPQNKSTFKGRHSRQGSTSSIGSLSIDGIREENSQSPDFHDHGSEINHENLKSLPHQDTKLVEKREEEWKKKLTKLEVEWKQKLDEKEREWKKQLESKEDEKLLKDKAIAHLQKSLQSAEEFKEKYCKFQEEKEQLEGFQSQEMSKIKHLLLAKERELSEKVNTLIEMNSQMATLKVEVARLRRFEEEISNIQDEMETLRHSSEQERTTLRSELAHSEENVRHLRDRVAVLERRTSADCVALGAPLSIDERIQGLLGERTLLERRLEEAHLHLADIKSSWSSKITSLETQVERLCRQAAEEGAERRRTEKECEQLQERVQQLEAELAIAAEEALQKSTLAQEIEQLRSELDAAVVEKTEVSVRLKETKVSLEEEVKRLNEALSSQQLEMDSFQTKSENEVKKLKDELLDLHEMLKSNSESSKVQISNLQQELEAEKLKSAEILATLDAERSAKEAAELKASKISDEVNNSNKCLGSKESELLELRNYLAQLESRIASKDEEMAKIQSQKQEISTRVEELEKERELFIAKSNQDKNLNDLVSDLESQIIDKNKSIKQLQQRLGDMKKTLQKELNLYPDGYSGDIKSNGTTGLALDDTSAAVLAPSSSHQVSQRRLQQQATSSSEGNNDVNFQYLKHVLLKFLTSREYEAKHLTRAVATLLHFSPEEEKFLRETLEWKMSWFGSRPNLGFGQTAKAIPPS